MLLSKIDEYGKVGWLTITIVAFWLAWPIGLAVLAYLAGSGRLRAWRAEFPASGGWFNFNMNSCSNNGPNGRAGFKRASSGNQAFDNYREDTLRGLEEEQREFKAFLERLRKARDKAEFDAFMAERRQRPTNIETPDSASA